MSIFIRLGTYNARIYTLKQKYAERWRRWVIKKLRSSKRTGEFSRIIIVYTIGCLQCFFYTNKKTFRKNG